MTGQLELFNTLTIIFLIGGILCAVAALFIFMRSGIREYFVLKHHDVNKDIEKETNGILEDIESEPEDHSVVNPSEILGKPAKVSNDEKPTEKQESCKGQLDDGSEKEDGAGETIATNTGKAQTKATSTHDENVEDGSEETTAIGDGSEETTAINRDQEEAAMTGEGTGYTEDLGKPSAIREDQKGIKQEEDNEEDALTGVLDNDTAETAVLDSGADGTSVLNAKRAKRMRENTIRDNTLWGAPMTVNKMTDLHNIVIVNTDRTVNSTKREEEKEN